MMLSSSLRKTLTNKNTLIFAMVFILFCTLVSGWRVTQTNALNLLIQKQLHAASSSCERLIHDLFTHEHFNDKSRPLLTESVQSFQKRLDSINLTEKRRFLLSFNAPQQKYEELIVLWQSELLPHINIMSNESSALENTSEYRHLNKQLTLLSDGLEELAEQFNTSHVSMLLNSNVLFGVSIFLLLILSYLLFGSLKNLFTHKALALQSINQVSHDLTRSNSLNIANKALIQLVKEPDSTEPFFLLLNEIEELTNAKSSAIFITPHSATQLVLLACTDPNDEIWSDIVPFQILPEAIEVEESNEIMEFYEDKQRPKFKFICVCLNKRVQDLAFLVIKIPNRSNMSDVVVSNLKERSERLSNIISSVQLARLKLRKAQFQERATIARELHDSLAQSLSYLKIQSSRLQNILTASDMQGLGKAMEIDAMMQDLRMNLNIAYRHLRELISTFRLTMGGKDFSQALNDSVEEFSKRSGIAFDIDNRLPADVLSVTEETQLLHIIRESLSNVVRHSRAKFALISILYTEQGQVKASVEDDGIGIPDISNPEQHFGIIIMQERAHTIGGDINLTERPGGGACLTILFQAGKQTI